MLPNMTMLSLFHYPLPTQYTPNVFAMEILYALQKIPFMVHLTVKKERNILCKKNGHVRKSEPPLIVLAVKASS